MKDKQELQSKLFFLDTQTYMARNFQFDYGVLKRLQTHLDEDDCHLLITDINVCEVRRHLVRKANDAVAAVKKASKAAMILRNTPDISWHAVFDEVTSEQISDALLAQFNRFLKNERVEVISTKSVDVESVLDAYFSEKPPFATAGKKAEFPDAFILHAINSISLNRGYKVYVVSADHDVKSFCAANENLISVDRLDELLQLVLENSNRFSEPAKFAVDVYRRFEGDLQKEIRELLPHSEYDFDDDFEPDGEIDQLEVERLEFLTHHLIDVSKEFATFELKVRLSVIVSASFPDYDRSPWDPEDKSHPFVFYNKLVRRYIRTAPVTVEFSFDDGIAANAKLEDVNIDSLIDLSAAKTEQISYIETDFGDEEEYGH